MLLLGSFLIFVLLPATQNVFHLTVQTTQFVDMQDQEHAPQTTAIVKCNIPAGSNFVSVPGVWLESWMA